MARWQRLYFSLMMGAWQQRVAHRASVRACGQLLTSGRRVRTDLRALAAAWRANQDHVLLGRRLHSLLEPAQTVVHASATLRARAVQACRS